MCEFSLPKELTTDNGKQFTREILVAFVEEYAIKLCYSTLTIHKPMDKQSHQMN